MVTDIIKLIWMMLKFAFVAWAFFMLASSVDASGPRPDSAIVHRISVDLIEINHVYYTDSKGVVNRRLDQALFRNFTKSPRYFDSAGSLVYSGFHLEIDGWVMLQNCRDYSNDKAYGKWSLERDLVIKNLQQQGVFVNSFAFKWDGEFVSPAQRIGGMYRMRLHDDDGIVTEITAKHLVETKTMQDTEAEERKRPHYRKLYLNRLKNFATVIGESAKKRD